MSEKPNLEAAIATLRNDVVLGQAKAQELALSGFDRLVQQLQQFAVRIRQGDDEIKRLRELCEKHKIDHNIKQQPSSSVKTEEKTATKPVEKSSG